MYLLPWLSSDAFKQLFFVIFPTWLFLLLPGLVSYQLAVPSSFSRISLCATEFSQNPVRWHHYPNSQFQDTEFQRHILYSRTPAGKQRSQGLNSRIDSEHMHLTTIVQCFSNKTRPVHQKLTGLKIYYHITCKSGYQLLSLSHAHIYCIQMNYTTYIVSLNHYSVLSHLSTVTTL